jgi:hypothetical protein
VIERDRELLARAARTNRVLGAVASELDGRMIDTPRRVVIDARADS